MRNLGKTVARAKEYILDSILENLAEPERGAIERSKPERARAGAGVAANLVRAGIAEWDGDHTWRIRFNRLGRQLNAWANR